MVCTNLYIVFEKIKRQKIPLEFIDWELYQDNMDARALNERIRKSIDYVAQSAPESDTEYVTLMESGSYHVANSNSKDNGLKILSYRGYKYLFLVCNEYKILINCEPDGKDFCNWVDYHRWEYIPDKEDFYRLYSGTDYYILNTYNAFCKYAGQHGNGIPSRELSMPFFDEAADCLQKSYYNLGTMVCTPMQFIIIKEDGNKAATFTIVVYDHLIIIVDYTYVNMGVATPVI